MKSNFEKSYAIIRRYEGGNVDDPRDPGGRTSRGVTQRVYDAYRERIGKPGQDVYKATDAEVKAIFAGQYWDVAQCDRLPSGVDLVVFDTSVNSGPKRAYKLLQASLNVVTNARLIVDGTPGMVTVEAARVAPDHDLLIEEFGRKRQGFYRGLKTFRTFGEGWTKRNRNVTKIATAWATGLTAPKVMAVEMAGSAKARDSDIRSEPISTTTAVSTTTTGAVGAGGIEQVQTTLLTAQDAVSPLSYTLEIAQYAFAGLVVAGLVLTGIVAFRQWRARRVDNAIASASYET